MELTLVELVFGLFQLFGIVWLFGYAMYQICKTPDDSCPKPEEPKPEEPKPENWYEQWEKQELAKAQASYEATIAYLKEVAARPVPRWPKNLKLPDNLFDNCIRCAPSYDPLGLCVKAPDTLGPFVFRNNLNDVSLVEWLLHDGTHLTEANYTRTDYRWVYLRR